MSTDKDKAWQADEEYRNSLRERQRTEFDQQLLDRTFSRVAELEAENARLRKGLERIVELLSLLTNATLQREPVDQALDEARRALEGE